MSAAEDATTERKAIKAERPLFNVQSNDTAEAPRKTREPVIRSRPSREPARAVLVRWAGGELVPVDTRKSAEADR